MDGPTLGSGLNESQGLMGHSNGPRPDPSVPTHLISAWYIQTCQHSAHCKRRASLSCEFYKLLNQQLHIICQNHFPCVSRAFTLPDGVLM